MMMMMMATALCCSPLFVFFFILIIIMIIIILVGGGIVVVVVVVVFVIVIVIIVFVDFLAVCVRTGNHYEARICSSNHRQAGPTGPTWAKTKMRNILSDQIFGLSFFLTYHLQCSNSNKLASKQEPGPEPHHQQQQQQSSVDRSIEMLTNYCKHTERGCESVSQSVSVSKQHNGWQWLLLVDVHRHTHTHTQVN